MHNWMMLSGYIDQLHGYTSFLAHNMFVISLSIIAAVFLDNSEATVEDDPSNWLVKKWDNLWIIYG